MEVDPPSPLQQQPYAIVRIKRKRNEEPLDALVVDASRSRKKSRGGVNVFQYAGTVEGAWNDDQLERHFAGLTRETLHKHREDKLLISPLPSNASSTSQASLTTSPGMPRQPSAQPSNGPMRQSLSRTYTIVPQQQLKEDPYARSRRPDIPPKVWSSKELEAMKRAAQFRLYEAVPSASTTEALSTSETDAEIEKFLPLLKDYLNVSDLTPPSSGVTKTSSSKSIKEDGVEDYVYDVFYHRPSQASYEPGSNHNVAKLTGLPSELSGLYDEDDSDEEYKDEDDEDSNEEDWHTNDYPDEEESDPESEEDLSDEFHEHSDYDELVHGDAWTYRDVMNL